MAISCSSAAAMTSSSRIEPARLNDGRNTVLGSGVNAVTEREKRIRRHDRALDRQALILRLDGRNLGRIDPAHLAGADADGHAVSAEHDRIRFDELGDLPCECQVGELLLVRCTLRDDLEIIRFDRAGVRALYEQATRNLLELESARQDRCARAEFEHPNVFLGQQYLARVRIDRRSGNNLDELPLDYFSCRGVVQRPVEGNDAAKCRGGVRSECLVVRGADIVVYCHTAGIGMLDDNAGGLPRTGRHIHRRHRYLQCCCTTTPCPAAVPHSPVNQRSAARSR